MKLSEESLTGYLATYVNLFVDITEDERGELRSLVGPELFPLLQEQARVVNPIAAVWGLPPAIIILQSWEESVVATRWNLVDVCSRWDRREPSATAIIAFAKWSEFALASAGACECPSHTPPFPDEDSAVADAVNYLVEVYRDRGDDVLDRFAHTRCLREPCDVLPEVVVASWLVANRADLIPVVQDRGRKLADHLGGPFDRFWARLEPGSILA